MKLLSIIPFILAVFMWSVGHVIEAELAMLCAIWFAVIGCGGGTDK